MYLILSFSSSAYRWTHFPCTSTNPVGSTHGVQQNWVVAGFKDDCVKKRFCDFWQSRRGKLHVFCTCWAAWPHQRNSNAPWWVTPNCCTTPSGKPQAGKYLIIFEFFAPVQKKTLKWLKYDNIPYRANAVLLAYNAWHHCIRKPLFSSVHT